MNAADYLFLVSVAFAAPHMNPRFCLLAGLFACVCSFVFRWFL